MASHDNLPTESLDVIYQFKPMIQNSFDTTVNSSGSALEAAILVHRSGDFQGAVGLYQAIVRNDPKFPDAWNLLGLAFLSLGQHQDALLAANQAISLAKHPKFLSDRSALFLAMGKPDEALADAQTAIKLDPNLSDACVNALDAMRTLRQHAKAVRSARIYLQTHPENADLWNNLGACLLDQQLFEEAQEAFGRACDINQQHFQGNENAARLAWHLGRSSEAAAFSAHSYALGTSDVQVLTPWAAHLEAQVFEVPGEAQTSRDTLVRDVWVRMMEKSQSAQLRGMLESADNRNALFRASSLCQRTGLKDRSIQMLSRALDLMTDDVDIMNNLGVAYFTQEDYRSALQHFKRGVELRGEFAMGWRNVGVCHFMLIEPEEARIAFERAFALDNTSVATSLYFFGQSLQCCEWSRYDELKRLVIDLGISVAAPDDLTASLAYLAAVEKAADMAIIAPRVATTLSGKCSLSLVLDHMPFKRKDRLRIAYFSYDFRTHPVGYLTEEIYALHDRSRFETIALSYGPDDASVFRKAVENNADQFVELRHLTTTEMVQRIRALDIDILVDLSGNTQGTRSEVVMHRVAPIQCHWLGYVWSMGHSSYDYIIGDPFSIPPSCENGYCEKIARLPHTLQVASRKLKAADLSMTRADQGLPQNAFVMCNFGSFSKIQPHLFKTWLSILKALPNAVLWLARTHRTPSQAFDRLRLMARENGVRDEQLIFSEPMGREEHLLRYRLADLALDTYPQGSGTTAIEALWMGCPMVSMADAGETLAVRMAGGILNAVHLQELVTKNEADYEALILELGRNPARVSALRHHLETQNASLPLFDTPKQVAYLERAFEQMALHAETLGHPASFTVAA